MHLRTGLALYNAENDNIQSSVETYSVIFRELSIELINQYLYRDQPYDCAGSVKIESLGIVLIEKMQGDNPNAIIGLPLITLISMLHKENFSLCF